jgi:hypothetical protein
MGKIRGMVFNKKEYTGYAHVLFGLYNSKI